MTKKKKWVKPPKFKNFNTCMSVHLKDKEFHKSWDSRKRFGASAKDCSKAMKAK